MSTDRLATFAQNFLMKCPVIGHVPVHGGIYWAHGITALVLYRDNEFQVEMFIVPPNFVLPAHTHPNVDSFEVYVSGMISFSLDGQLIVDGADPALVGYDGLSLARGHTIRVKDGVRHGGAFGPTGGVFLSIQHWLNGVKPQRISDDFVGDIESEDGGYVKAAATLAKEASL